MPSPRPLRADARRNREALLTAAREAFLVAEDAHVEEIARRAGVAVGTLYRHFETREALVAAVYRQEVAELCEAPAELLAQHSPDEALRTFLLLLVEHASVGRGMGEVLESIMATDSPVFEDTRNEMALALEELLTAGAEAGVVRSGVSGRIVLRALGGICGLRADGWKDDAKEIVTILYDGLRYGATRRG
ncbi:Transcriptional regulator, TetR family [Streptomyces sp. YIM 130001]|uniref:TetR/AcrR family transcriptional regulator n=1 Tax=Streptomyces sp. YIM 130001 TaxID=2259644 RepID=UPI000E6532A5|nr:TetR/AcrR family transcriptional regulator [Streptomyces sp. YIM 130001]RII14620.1 Transcriptional regulator, TetR family [Streptomyces sp. YIM 130001]